MSSPDRLPPPTLDAVVTVENVSKRYEIYERPQDRLKQSLVPRLATLIPALQLRSRSYFKEFWALRNVSFRLNRGEVLGILGRNGAGKSTLLQIIAGTLTATTGTIDVRGRTAALLELGSGFSPEFTGRENVRLNAALLGLSSDQINRRLEEIIAFADVGEFIEQPVRTYSSGMMMRLAFAVQTAVDPQLLIVDEALSVGDARFQKKCFARLEQLRQRGTTILFVTHDTGTVVQFCTRAIVLDGGVIFTEGTPQAVAREYHRLLFASDEAKQAPHDSLAPQSVPHGISESANESSPRAVEDSNAEPVGQTAAVDAEAPPIEGLVESVEVRPSVREIRYGSREAEIYVIGIRDQAGRETRLVEVHKQYEFYYRLRFNADIRNALGYGFIISNLRGVELFATKAHLHGKAIPPSKAGFIYECRLRAVVPIVAGTYFLSAAIAYENGPQEGEFLDCRFDALQFQVIGSTRAFTTCIFDMQGELSHEEAAEDATRAVGGHSWALQ